MGFFSGALFLFPSFSCLSCHAKECSPCRWLWYFQERERKHHFRLFSCIPFDTWIACFVYFARATREKGLFSLPSWLFPVYVSSFKSKSLSQYLGSLLGCSQSYFSGTVSFSLFSISSSPETLLVVTEGRNVKSDGPKWKSYWVLSRKRNWRDKEHRVSLEIKERVCVPRVAAFSSSSLE